MKTATEEKPDLFLFDQKVREEGFTLVCGVDEAGRGPLVGSVVAAAVILPSQEQLLKSCPDLANLNDSKKLTEKKREKLFPMILEHAQAYGIGEASCREIEEVNILNATFLAMGRAVEDMKKRFGVVPDILLVDGNQNPHIMDSTRTVIKGDANSASIAAASILAKVTRDREMIELDKVYPQYGFAKHKGYGTKAHYATLEEHGPCQEHRMSFLEKFYKRQAENHD